MVLTMPVDTPPHLVGLCLLAVLVYGGGVFAVGGLGGRSGGVGAGHGFPVDELDRRTVAEGAVTHLQKNGRELRD